MVESCKNVVRLERIGGERAQTDGNYERQNVEGANMRKVQAHITQTAPNDLYEKRQRPANPAKHDLTSGSEWAVCQVLWKEESGE